MTGRFCSILLSSEKRKGRRPDWAASPRSGNGLPLSEVLIEPWDSWPLTVPGPVGMLWGETGRDSDVALGCLHIPGATRAPRAICRFWT